MPTYKRPGVYINETLTPLATASEDPGLSTAVFVGTNAGGGPLVPTRVTSWTQFCQIYGGFGDSSEYLPFAVYSYFNNGGGACYVVRAANSNAVAATKTFKMAATDVLKIDAQSPGLWGNSVLVSIVASTTASGKFDLVITKGTVVERFTEVTCDPADPRNVVSLVNSPYSGSKIVKATYMGPTPWTAGTGTPDAAVDTALTTGTNGTGTVDLVAATKTLENISGTFDVNLPGVNAAATINALSTWAKTQGNVFLVVDGVQGASGDTSSVNATALTNLVSGGTPLTRESVVAVYGPWLTAENPAVSGGMKSLPPGGFVLAQYARTDVVRGVQKSAAGIDTALRGVLAPEFTYSQTEQDTLNSTGINVIKTVPGAGICIWGARTLSVGMPDRYISIRRTLINIKYAIVDLTKFAVFEENDDDLRSQIEDIVAQYLRTMWSVGALAGNSEAEAFTVQCDGENNTPTSIAQGFVNVTVGVSPQTPAEFIIFNIGQTVSGSTVDES